MINQEITDVSKYSSSQYFQSNYGQLNDNDIRFYYVSDVLIIFFYDSKILFQFSSPSVTKIGIKSDILDFQNTNYGNEVNSLKLPSTHNQVPLIFKNSNFVSPFGSGELSHISNFYFGINYSIENVKTYNKIVYHEIYNNIDLVYYITKDGLKYEFIVYPGGNPDEIELAYDNIHHLVVEERTIEIATQLNKLYDHELTTYQTINEMNVLVLSKFIQISQYSYGFYIENYDRSLPLIIDPWLIQSSQFYGSGGVESVKNDFTDSSNNYYVIGQTSGQNLPLINQISNYSGGSFDIFIAKFASNGTILFSSYLGGSNHDAGNGIFVDDEMIIITGTTSSADFPMSNGYNTTYGGDGDGFIVKLSLSGNLLNTTFLGGNALDTGNSISKNSLNNIIVGGMTMSSDFPVTEGYQNSLNGMSDMFVTWFDSKLNLIKSMLIGGDDIDTAIDLEIDSLDNILIAGVTYSSNFPLVNSYYSDRSAINDVVLLKITSYGIVWSTLLGGNLDEYLSSICVDNNNNIILAGRTASTNFPNLNGINQTNNGGYDGFISKFSSYGSLIFSTYLGGSNYDVFNDVEIDNLNNIYAIGQTYSNDYPVKDSLYDTYYFGSEIIITQLNTEGELKMSTYISGENDDTGASISVINVNELYITGITNSSFFPIDVLDEKIVFYDVFILKYSIDMWNPELSHPNDIIMPENSGNITIQWEVHDDYAGTFDLYVDNQVKISNSTWISGNISIEFQFPERGVYQISLILWDLNLNFIRDEVIVTVVDNISPDVSSLLYVSYVEDTMDNYFSWTMGDKYPGLFNISIDTQIIYENSPWINGTFYVNIDGLTVGNHSLVISISDLDGNIVIQEVTIQVFEIYQELPSGIISESLPIIVEITTLSSVSNSGYIGNLIISILTICTLMASYYKKLKIRLNG
ncbi:MAG: hypothetical protein OEZ01_08105 [Candidatus Heimdallarchaeota archaeon]|nr:hypothetical protein [Candidatus Heimdallarchaeota archaeon]